MPLRTVWWSMRLALSFCGMLLSLAAYVDASEGTRALAIVCDQCYPDTALGQLRASRLTLQIQSQLRASSSSNINNISVVTLAVSAKDISPTWIYRNGVIHVTVLEGLDQSFALRAPNVSFTFFVTQGTSSLPSNAETVEVPWANIGFETGLLAGVQSARQSISLWYDSDHSSAVKGFIAGVQNICPLCGVHTFQVCSVIYDCPGQLQRAVAANGNADVVVLFGTPGSQDILFRFLADYNMDNPLQTKNVIVGGPPVANITAEAQQYILGLCIQSSSAFVEGAVATINGTFSSVARAVSYSWTYSSHAVAAPKFREFTVQRQLFNWGALDVDFDPLQAASSGLQYRPFLAIGSVINVGGDLRSDSTTASHLPDLAHVSVCGVDERLFLIDPSLTAMTVFDMDTMTVQSVSLTLARSSYDAGKSSTSVASQISALYDPAAVLNDNVTIRPRVQMACHVVQDVYRNEGAPLWSTEILLVGGLEYKLDTGQPTNTTVMEVLLLRIACVEPRGPDCDFFLLHNLTHSFLEVSVWDDTRKAQLQWSSISHQSGFVGNAPTFYQVATVLDSFPSPRRVVNEVFLLHNDAANGTTSVVVVNASDDYRYLASFLLLAPPQRSTSQTSTPLLTSLPLRSTLHVVQLGLFLALDARRQCLVSVSEDTLVNLAATARLRDPAASLLLAGAWSDFSTAIPLQSDESPLCVFFDQPAVRVAVIVQGPRSVRLFHYSTSLKMWVFQVEFPFVVVSGSSSSSTTSSTVFDCVALNFMQSFGGAAILLPRSGDINAMVAAMYSAKMPTCGPGEVLSPSQDQCVSCRANERVTADGFCGATSPSVPSGLSQSALIGIVIGAVVGALAMTLAGWATYHYHLSPRATQQATMKRAQRRENAPSSGHAAVLAVFLGDLDLLWGRATETQTKPDAGPRADESSRSAHHHDDHDQGHHHHHHDGGSDTLRHSNARAVMDVFFHSVLKSAAANHCYVATFRGDFAVVVAERPFDLLCVAVETSYAMLTHLENPVRLLIGLQYGDITRTEDVGLGRWTYSGSGIRSAAKFASVSKDGGLVVSDGFLEAVGDAAMKHLGLMRGFTQTLRTEEGTMNVRELIIRSVHDEFASGPYAATRERRKKVLQRQLALSGTHSGTNPQHHHHHHHRKRRHNNAPGNRADRSAEERSSSSKNAYSGGGGTGGGVGVMVATKFNVGGPPTNQTLARPPPPSPHQQQDYDAAVSHSCSNPLVVSAPCAAVDGKRSGAGDASHRTPMSFGGGLSAVVDELGTGSAAALVFGASALPATTTTAGGGHFERSKVTVEHDHPPLGSATTTSPAAASGTPRRGGGGSAPPQTATTVAAAIRDNEELDEALASFAVTFCRTVLGNLAAASSSSEGSGDDALALVLHKLHVTPHFGLQQGSSSFLAGIGASSKRTGASTSLSLPLLKAVANRILAMAPDIRGLAGELVVAAHNTSGPRTESSADRGASSTQQPPSGEAILFSAAAVGGTGEIASTLVAAPETTPDLPGSRNFSLTSGSTSAAAATLFSFATFETPRESAPAEFATVPFPVADPRATLCALSHQPPVGPVDSGSRADAAPPQPSAQDTKDDDAPGIPVHHLFSLRSDELAEQGAVVADQLGPDGEVAQEQQNTTLFVLPSHNDDVPPSAAATDRRTRSNTCSSDGQLQRAPVEAQVSALATDESHHGPPRRSSSDQTATFLSDFADAHER